MPTECKACKDKGLRIKELERKVDKLHLELEKHRDASITATAYEQMAIEVLEEVGVDYFGEPDKKSKENYKIVGYHRCRVCHSRWDDGGKPKHEAECRLDEVLVQSENP